MTKRAAIILTAITLIVGLIAGAYLGFYLNRQLLGQYIITSLTVQNGVTVRELSRLRSGDTNKAIEMLEIQLDGDLILLGALLAQPGELNHDPATVKIIKQAKHIVTSFLASR